MASENHLGTTYYVSAALPATNDATGFEALTWTELGDVMQGPQLGYEHEQIDIPATLKNAYVKSVKGPGKGVDTPIQCLYDPTSVDAGQAIVIAAADDDDGHLSIKAAKGSGTDNAVQTGDPVTYAQGYAHSYLPNQATSTSYEGFSVSFRSNAKSVTDTEPA